MTESLRLQQYQLMLVCILYASLGLVVSVHAQHPCHHVDTINAGNDITHVKL